MAKLSSAMLSLLAPIAEEIDKELDKHPDERETILLKTSNPKTLKNNLATYKSLYRRDEWNSRFLMTKRSDCVEISFGVSKRLTFSIERPTGTEQHDITIERKESSPVLQHAALEMQDRFAIQHLMLESPLTEDFLISYLDQDTQLHLEDPSIYPRTPFFLSLDRNGYKWKVTNNRLHVSKL